jgi:hypothetical protein
LLRAVSIGAVITGHWLIAAPWIRDGQLRLDQMLGLQPWTQWLSWLFQVMPIFFMVGGYSNAASWEAARRSGTEYGVWVRARLQRLIGPVVPLIAFWGIIGAIAHQAGVPEVMIRVGSQAALVPIWFLAIYVVIVLLVPLTHAAWRRFGVGSFCGLAAAAVGVDLLRFGVGWVDLAWVNYLFVWSAVHQIGYIWRDGKLGGIPSRLGGAVFGLLLLIGLVVVAGYPRSMVGVPGEAVSNTLPPSLAMLALGLAQGGLLLSLEIPARRWLAGHRAWAATILVNGMIMTVYLWHLTAMILLTGLLNLLGGFGLRLVPGSGTWWATRPIWIAVLVVALLPFLLLFGGFERAGGGGTVARLAGWRVVFGAVLVCVGLALVALHGVGGDGPTGIKLWLVLMPLVGAALAGAVPLRRPRTA